jgi:hypothetical protein
VSSCRGVLVLLGGRVDEDLRHDISSRSHGLAKAHDFISRATQGGSGSVPLSGSPKGSSRTRLASRERAAAVTMPFCLLTTTMPSILVCVMRDQEQGIQQALEDISVKNSSYMPNLQRFIILLPQPCSACPASTKS